MNPTPLAPQNNPKTTALLSSQRPLRLCGEPCILAAIAGMVLMFCISIARAQDVPATTAASIDKWQFSLFNPVPASAMRDMDTDRPNKTNTPHTIDAGHLQIETGFVDYLYIRNRYGGTNTRTNAWNLGQLNFRLGILNNLELNVVVNPYEFLNDENYSSHTTMRQDGLGDTVVGGTLNLWGNEGGDTLWQTGLSIQPQLKIPTARENLGNGHGEFFLGVPFAMNLPASAHLGIQTTISYERNSSGTGDVAGWQNSVSVDRVFFSKLDIYLEYWAHVSSERHAESQQTIDTGLTYSLTDNIVLDSGVNFGLNRASTNVEWLSGFSVRF